MTGREELIKATVRQTVNELDQLAMWVREANGPHADHRCIDIGDVDDELLDRAAALLRALASTPTDGGRG